MIINGISGMLETLAELMIAIFFFVKLCGGEKVRGIRGRVLAVVLSFLYLIAGCYIHGTALQSLNGTIFILLPLLAAALTALVRTEVLCAAAWSIFMSGSALIVRVPVVLICAAKYRLDYMECVVSRHVWPNLCVLLIYFTIFLICVIYRKNIVRFLRNMPFRNIIFIMIGFIEIAIVCYVINTGLKPEKDKNDGLTGSAFMLFLFFVGICVGFVILLEYQEIVRTNHLLHSNEMKMKFNYNMLSDEIAKDYKAVHDRRHDMEYIYECMKEQDYEKGLRYIEKINALDEKIYKNSTWTGYGTVDYLINKAVRRCRENEVRVLSDIEFTVIPIAEYDFFTVLANLLDNAIEAALKCEGEKRYIAFNLKSFYNNFSIYISNGYQDEPRRDGDRFISDNAGDKRHGWGVECVRDVVRKYDGIMDIEYHDGKFIVDIIFIG